VAGVPEVALCVPPQPDGRVHPASLAAARLAGVTEIWRVGGAQAVAALAYGTETIPAVDLIVGPGNIYVALAKQEVAGVVGIESLAGPSELAVVADAGAPAGWIALDLLAQAEHGPLGSCLLVTWSPELAAAVHAHLDETDDTFRTVLVDGPEAAVDVTNAYAPEHLQLMVADPEPLLKRVRHAGAVFCGYEAATALGDYIAGPNHVLPTAGTARFAQALRVSAFEKVVHAVFVQPGGLDRLVEPAARIADAEGLTAHARSLRERLS
jgi:histidinol dehydrogenase